MNQHHLLDEADEAVRDEAVRDVPDEAAQDEAEADTLGNYDECSRDMCVLDYCCCQEFLCYRTAKEHDRIDLSEREHLFLKWASGWGQCCHQPLKEISCYLGKNIAIYFSLLGIEIIWLTALFIIGIIFTAGSFKYTTDERVNPEIPICRANHSNYYMCPQCDGECDFWYLREDIAGISCTRTIRLLFDNPVMWGYSFVVVIGALVFCWFVTRQTKRMNDGAEVSLEMFPTLPHGNKSLGLWIGIFFFTILVVSLSVGISMCMLFLNWALIHVLTTTINTKNIMSLEGDTLHVLVLLFIAVVQGLINIFIRWLYVNICNKLLDTTELRSLPYILMALFVEAASAYTQVIYRVYFRDQFIGDPQSTYNHIGIFRYDYCPTYGCFLDLGIYIFIVMITSKFIFPFLKLLRLSKLLEWFLKLSRLSKLLEWSQLLKQKCLGICSTCCCTCNNDSKDYYDRDIITYYIDIVISYGFVTLFAVAGGVLAVAAALLTAIVQVRVNATNYLLWRFDASKLRYHQNEPSLEAQPWRLILLLITFLSLFTNIAIIITNSQIVPDIAFKISTASNDSYLTNFFPNNNLTRLIDIKAFPTYHALHLKMYDMHGNVIKDSSGKAILYLPFVNFTCLSIMLQKEITEFNRESFLKLTPNEREYIINSTDIAKPAAGSCFDHTATCRTRGFLKNTKPSDYLRHVRRISCWAFVFALLVIIIYTIIALLSIKMSATELGNSRKIYRLQTF